MGIAEYRDTHPKGAGAIVVIDCLTLYSAVDGKNLLYEEHEMKKIIGICILAGALLMGLGCTNPRSNETSYKDAVSKALEQADLRYVTVTEDRGKNTITLGGKVHSGDARAKAGDVAKSAAPSRIIANEISVQPVDAASEAKDIASDLDAGIEKNYKAALISTALDKQHIRFSAKNGVLTVKGTVKTARQRQEAQKVAAEVPNVKQVVNEIEIRR